MIDQIVFYKKKQDNFVDHTIKQPNLCIIM